VEEVRKQVEEHKEELKRKDELLSQHQTQVQELSSAKETTTEPMDESSTSVVTGNDEGTKEEDNQEYVNIDTSSGDVKEEEYVNVDTSSGDVKETEENSKENEGSGEPEDYSANYVNVPMDDDDDNKDNKEVENDEGKGEEADKVPSMEFDHVIKTETLSSTSQLTRAKVSSTLRRKPPSRSLIRRAAEESGSQENLFEVGNTAEDDYVNLPANKAVRQQPTQKTEDSDKPQAQEKEKDKQPDLNVVKKDDKIEEKVIITYL